jgi:hypothetical protein
MHFWYKSSFLQRTLGWAVEHGADELLVVTKGALAPRGEHAHPTFKKNIGANRWSTTPGGHLYPTHPGVVDYSN